MTDLIKPMPDHHFHAYSDSMLTELISIWRRHMTEETASDEICRELIDEAYKVLGYRCALEYVLRYEKAEGSA